MFKSDQAFCSNYLTGKGCNLPAAEGVEAQQSLEPILENFESDNHM